MRFIAKVANHPEVKRLMICDSEDCAYLFLYEIEEDGGALADEWYETRADAMESAKDEYGVYSDAWVEIPDPPEYCQHDWIAPVRVPGRESGNPEWGKLEALRDGKWVPLLD